MASALAVPFGGAPCVVSHRALERAALRPFAVIRVARASVAVGWAQMSAVERRCECAAVLVPATSSTAGVLAGVCIGDVHERRTLARATTVAAPHSP